MKTTRRAIYLILITAILLLVSSGCDDIGVFAQIAVSEQLSEGLLPEGASPSKVMHISGYANYDFISTGGSLWYRDITDRNEVTTATRWKKISLNGWGSVQSIDQTDDYIVLTMVREDVNNHRVQLFYFGAGDFVAGTNKGTVTYNTVTGAQWDDNGSSFSNVYVFCPNPGNADEVFVNVLQTDDTFGQEFKYNDSLMYQEDLSTIGWDDNDMAWGNINSPNILYIDSAASDGTDYVFSAIENADAATDNGLLLDLAGNEHIDTSAVITRPVRGITYLPDLAAYIGGGTELDASGEYPIYVSDNLATDSWAKITGTSSGFRAQSFLDVSTTTAGGPGFGQKILAGTQSFSGTDARGYMEIETEGHATLADWTVLSSGDRIFALPNNYLLSDLVEVSITALTMYNDGADNFVYASTSTHGLWSINADSWPAEDTEPRWKTE